MPRAPWAREEKETKENVIEVQEEVAPPPNVLPFPAAHDDDAASTLSEIAKPLRETTQQVAALLQLPASEGLSRIVADYLPSPGLSLVGEVDAAREWVDDSARNRKG